MAFLKIALFLTLFVAVTYASVETTPRENHNLIDCDGDQSANRLAMRKTVEAKGRFLQVQRGTLKFPEFTNGKKIITCIKVTDLMSNGKGGYVDILDGGVQFYNAILQFTSQRSRGYKFLIEIYTEP